MIQRIELYGKLCEAIRWRPREAFPCQLVALQHALPTVEGLLDALWKFGVVRGDRVVFGKMYSTVADRKWVNKIEEPDKLIFKRGLFKEAYQKWLREHMQSTEQMLLPKRQSRGHGLIVIDDGGFITPLIFRKNERFMSRGCAVEQTSSGLYSGVPDQLRRIAVASSAVKRHVESLFIGRSIVDAIRRKQIPLGNGQKVGVIGLGNVGKRVTQALLEAGVSEIYGWDISERAFSGLDPRVQFQDARYMLEQCDLVLGCTGTDCLKSLDIQTLKRRKEASVLLVSCSSTDVEFRTIFRKWINERTGGTFAVFDKSPDNGGAFEDIEAIAGRTKFLVLNGGFPINLDRTVECDPEAEYMLTRLLMFCGVVQAVHVVTKGLSCKTASLLTIYQRAAIKIWKGAYRDTYNALNVETRALLNNEEWLELESRVPPKPLPPPTRQAT